MKLKVVRQFRPDTDTNFGVYVCIDEDGVERNVDLIVGHDGEFDIDEDFDPESLIGLEVECDWLTPYVELAISPKLPTSAFSSKKSGEAA